MKWATHIAWGIAVLGLMSMPPVPAAVASALHTAAVDMLGHSRGRRARWHWALSIAVAALMAAWARSLPLLALGPLHIILDALSPGRLAASWAYNSLWIAAALFLICTYSIPCSTS